MLSDRNVDGFRVKFVELTHLSDAMMKEKAHLEV